MALLRFFILSDCSWIGRPKSQAGRCHFGYRGSRFSLRERSASGRFASSRRHGRHRERASRADCLSPLVLHRVARSRRIHVSEERNACLCLSQPCERPARVGAGTALRAMSETCSRRQLGRQDHRQGSRHRICLARVCAHRPPQSRVCAPLDRIAHAAERHPRRGPVGTRHRIGDELQAEVWQAEIRVLQPVAAG